MKPLYYNLRTSKKPTPANLKHFAVRFCQNTSVLFQNPKPGLSSLRFLLWLLLAVISPFQELIAQPTGSPCHAVRWGEGGHWTGTGANGCGVDDSNPPSPQGVVRCANAADTESGIDPNTTYDPTEFLIVPTSCIDPDDFTPATVDAPFSGQRLSWFNFDVRPYAGLYDFQTIATGSYELNWALYADTLSQYCGTGTDDLSGDCAGTLVLLSCGTDFNGWAPQPFITPIFDQPTNLFLAVWRRGATNSSNDQFDFTFKARYGCGDFCFTQLFGPDTVTCNPDGSYTVRQNINASNTTITVTAPGNTGIVYSHTPFFFTTASAEPAVNTGWVEVTFPASVMNYSITFTPSTEANSDYCDILNVTGAAPDCCIPPTCPSLTGGTLVCPGSTTEFCVPTGLGGYMWSVSGSGTIVGPTNEECVSVTAGSSCNSSFTLTLVVGEPGCTSSCNYMITVDDDTPPMITCPSNVTIQCTASTLPANTGTATATDLCSTPVVTYTDGTVAGACPQEYTITRTWRATDACGNSSTCNQIITVDDSTPPVITCPGNVTVECTASTAPANTGTATATDNCSTPMVTHTDVTVGGACPQEYTITRTWRATDACGNSSTCNQIITVDDSTPPMITCPGNVTIECSASTAPANTGTATATDNCSTPAVTFTDVTAAGACASEYTITRTWRATDGCGNSSTCNQTITLDDSTPPVITCPGNVTVECTASTAPGNTGTATATDNCSTPVVTHTDVTVAGACPQEYTITRTWRATDACGNSSTCNQIITVDDSTPPVITCPGNVTVECTASTAPANTGTATATDNCSTPVVTHTDVTVAGACPQEYTITRTWRATDACGNSSTCNQIITVDDSTPPVITCPGNVTVECTASTAPGNTGTATATDNCSTPVVTHTDVTVAGACPQEYTITRTWRATDACGNSSTCNQIITVDDSTPPMITCPVNVTVECTASTAPASTGTATATDNCSTPIVTHTDVTVAGACPQEYTITRTWRATDACGNSSTCNQIITVDDSTPPMITCPVNVTIECTASTLPANTGTATATDNCSIPTVTFTDISLPGACPSEYVISRLWRATDACGNSSTCTQTITVDDSTPPVITCPVNVTIECSASTLPATTGIATATDNCSTPIVTYSEVTVAGACPQEYTITRTWRATDACGNSSTCNQIITVDDSTPPMITCPVNVTVECTASTAPANTGTATATDNCSTPIVTHTDVTVAGACPQEYTITRTWRATDACGNSSTCNQVITVDDSTPPMITCPVNVTVECTASTAPASTGTATATDNCSTPIVTHTDVTVAGACPQEYTITRTWRATDACGNSSTCNQIITVDDSTPPMITCPVNVTIECTASTLPANTGTATATDNCSIPTVTFTDISLPGACPSEYVISRLWRATDACGNSSTCTQTITVDDSTPPVITCPGNVTIECTASTLPINTGTATATDNCSTPIVTYTDISLPGACPSEYVITRLWRATDACGNSSTCNQIITVDDSTPPVISCPGDITIECTESTSPDVTGNASATDNCSIPAVTYSDITTEGACPQEYFITRTWLATDACGNSNTCVQFIEIEDTTPPVCMTQDITIATDPATGYVIILPVDIDNESTDNCGPVMLSISQDSFTCDDVGLNVVILTVTDLCGNSSTCTANVTVNQCFDPCVRINSWVYLEGAATDPNGQPTYAVPMRTDLNDLQVLPGQTLVDPFFGNKYTPAGQPYDIAPWNYFGTEGDTYDSGMDPMFGDAGYPATVVDWVLVSLRADSAGTGGPVCQAAALLHEDGYIDFVEAFDCCDLNVLDSFYVVVEHRNHLIVMSHVKVPIVLGVDSSTITYDFRFQQSYVDDPFGFGVFAQKEILPEIFAMYAGNGDQVLSGQSDTDINFDDRSFWEMENGDIGEYRIGDYNLNGDTNFNDRVTWERNNGVFTSVPRD